MKQVLILGFGAGRVAHILRYELRTNARITAVELDPEVIEFSRKYLDLDGYDNLIMVNSDAFEFVKECNSSFTLVVSDVFVDKDVPAKFLGAEYVMELVRLTQQQNRNNEPYCRDKTYEAETHRAGFMFSRTECTDEDLQRLED